MHKAILIEDEDLDAARVEGILRAADFEIVDRYTTATTAQIGCSGRSDLVDLLIIDRRLPQDDRTEPLDSVGDELLEAVLEKLSDTLVIVFTAHGDTENAENATAERGMILVDEDHAFDRVRHFQKTNYRAFEEYVDKLSAAIGNLNAIDVEGIEGTERTQVATRRLLRKLAVLDGGSAVIASPLDGGRTKRAVYNARVLDGEGTVRSRRVVKVGPLRRRTESAGYATLLDSALIAAPVSKVFGLSAGFQAQVLQLAGEDPLTLFSILDSDVRVATGILRTVIFGYTSIPIVERAVPVQQLFVFANESSVQLLCQSLGEPTVAPNLVAMSKIGAQHGDLHAGNILVTSGSPVLIDFDNTLHSSSAVDPVTLLLSSIFHASSPLRYRPWITENSSIDIFAPQFLDGCPAPDWFAEIVRWLVEARTSTREVSALTLSYIARQLGFPDFPSSGPLHNAAIRIARHAAEQLSIV